MNESRKTKKALRGSLLALFLCVVLLIGTTFAWFTDTATTGVNKIQSGRLDVELQYSTDGGDTWANAEGETLDFQKANGAEAEAILWEPGCRYELPKLRVVNNGNLALKYKIQITGIKGDEKLNEVIDWTIDGEDINLTEKKLRAGEEGDGFTIKGQMQTSAGNEYQGLSIDGISITVVATQDTVESDSFNNMYDANAPVVYPKDLNEDSFNKATSVNYSSTYGGYQLKTATTAEEIAAHPAVAAYDKDGTMTYAADLRAAIADGASVVYCKKNVKVSTTGAHLDVVKDTKIYANGADFGGGDLSIIGEGNYNAPESDITNVDLYNAKNLVVWGQPTSNGRTWNINFYDCSNNGYNFFMYRNGENSTDKFNLTMNNCYAEGYNDSTVHATADGSIKIKNCTFVNNCAPVNIAHKQSGTLDVNVENSKFINCGKVDPSNDYFAPVRFVNNSSTGALNVSLVNNTFTDTVGTNGDVLLGDYRSGKSSHAIKAKITTKKAIMVKSSDKAAYKYDGGTINIGK